MTENEIEKARRRRENRPEEEDQQIKQYLDDQLQKYGLTVDDLRSIGSNNILLFLQGNKDATIFFAENISQYCKNGDPRREYIIKYKNSILNRIEQVLKEKPFNSHLMLTENQDIKTKLEEARKIIQNLL
jgi:hypothetical protein